MLDRFNLDEPVMNQSVASWPTDWLIVSVEFLNFLIALICHIACQLHRKGGAQFCSSPGAFEIKSIAYALRTAGTLLLVHLSIFCLVSMFVNVN